MLLNVSHLGNKCYFEVKNNSWGVQIWVIFSVMGINTSVSTLHYPLVLLFPKDRRNITQVGRTIRMCKIQLSERWPWHPPNLAFLFHATPCFPLPTPEVAHLALLFPFSVVPLTF